MRMNEAPELLTVTEAARLLRIGRNTAYSLVARGVIPHVRLGHLIRVPRASLEGWLTGAGAPKNPEAEALDGGLHSLHRGRG